MSLRLKRWIIAAAAVGTAGLTALSGCEKSPQQPMGSAQGDQRIDLHTNNHAKPMEKTIDADKLPPLKLDR